MTLSVDLQGVPSLFKHPNEAMSVSAPGAYQGCAISHNRGVPGACQEFLGDSGLLARAARTP